MKYGSSGEEKTQIPLRIMTRWHPTLCTFTMLSMTVGPQEIVCLVLNSMQVQRGLGTRYWFLVIGGQQIVTL